MFVSSPKRTIVLWKILFVFSAFICVLGTGFSQVKLDLEFIKSSDNFYRKGLYKIKATVDPGFAPPAGRATLQISFPNQLRSLSPTAYPVDFGNAGKQTFYFKLLMDNASSQSDTFSIKGQVFSMGENIPLANAYLEMAPPSGKKVLLENLSEEVISKGRKFLLQYRISNPASKEKKVALRPLKEKDIEIQEVALVLLPGQDTIVQLEGTIENISSIQNYQRISVLVQDENNKIIRSLSSLLVPRLSKKVFTPSNSSNNTLENIQLGYQGGGLGNNFALEYQKDFLDLESNSSISFQSNYFHETNELRVINSYYLYEDEKWLYGLGNLSKNDELNIFGRGAYVGWKQDEYTFTFGALNHNGNIVAPIGEKNNVRGNSVYMDVDQKLKNYWNLKSVIVGNFNPNDNKAVWSVNFSKETESSFWSLKGGVGVNFDKKEIKAPGGFAEVIGFKKLGRFSVDLNNYVATLDHPGRRAGQQIYLNRFYFNPTPSWRMAFESKIRAFPKPSPRFPVNRAHQINYRQEYSLSVEKNISSSLKAGVYPGFLRQRAGYYVGNREVESFQNINPNIKGLLEYRDAGTRASIQGEIGKYQTQNEEEILSNIVNWKVAAEFTWKRFNGNFRYQNGSVFFLEELDQGGMLDGRQFLSMGFGTNQRFFKDRVNFKIGGQMVYNSTRGKWYQNYWTGIDAPIAKQWQVYGEGNLLKTGLQTIVSWEVGVRKSINSFNQKGKKSSLKYTVLDETTLEPVANLLVTIGNQKLITDNKGEVKLKRLPHDTYRVEIRDPQGLYLTYKDSVLVHKTMQSEILYLKSPKKLKGTLKLKREKFSDTRFVISGIKIVLKNTEGQEFSTFTNDEGEYSFKVTTGKY
ncbi:MAG: hypothetical protein KDC24_11620, partial [Saprospiraceae bacterium]|nr:hypothetical protein [Saprospiraceae bacterium]